MAVRADVALEDDDARLGIGKTDIAAANAART